MKKEKIKDPAKKGLGVIWKSILITLSSIIGVAGIIFLGMYLAGSFTTEPVNPENLFFANKVVVEEKTTYVSNSGNPYNVDSNFEVYVSTSTEESNQNEIEFSFPKNQTQYYLTKVESTEGLSSSVKLFYANGENGLEIYASCSSDYEGATHITNGIIIAPRYSLLNKEIKILIAVAPNEFGSSLLPETKLYNVGGYSQLIATSLSNVAIGSTSAQINVDVPIEEIDVVAITGDNLSSDSVPGTNENLLGNKINTESLFSTIINVTPSRAIYKYGKDGSNGEAEYKTIIFALDNDVNNSGKIISFIDSNNEQIENSYCENGKVFVFDGKTTKGQSFSTTTLTGNIKIHARAFKTAVAQDLASGNLSEIFSLMIGEGAVSSDKEFEIQQIAIGGFSATEDYDINNPLKVGINKENMIFANNTNSANNLGIEITAGQGSAQNNIKNILISIQYSNGTKWFDATKANGTIPQLFSLDSRNTIVEKKIGEEGFNFFRPILTSASNNSYWNLFVLPSSENLANYGITDVQIKIYYLNPEINELVLDDTAYGPYSVITKVSETIAPVLGWNESEEIKTNSTLGAGIKNERVYFEGSNNAQNNIIYLQNLPKIENIGNSTYNIVKYFISSENENLQNYLNVTKYNGTISGVTDSNIYLVNETETNLVVRAIEESEIEFKLFFAVVEHSFSDVLINSDGTFNIVKVPTNAIVNLVYAPIRVQKTLDLSTDVEIGMAGVDKVVGKDENGGDIVENTIIKPYSNSNEEFFLQNQKDNIKLTLTINNNQTDLFFKLAKEGNLNFVNNSDLYSLINGNKIDLEDVFSKIFIQIEETKEIVGEDEVIKKTFVFGGTTYEIAESEIKYVEGEENKAVPRTENVFELNGTSFEIDEENGYVIYGKNGNTLTINLSTNSINFGENDEKTSKIALNYEISATNAPESIKNQTIEKELNIYSGKVVEAYFETENNYENGPIWVSKTFEDGAFSIKFSNEEFSINGLEETSLVEEKEGAYFLNVFVNGFGIDDSYVVESSDSSVVSLTWIDGKYQISFVGNGEATLTLSLNYPNSAWAEKQITIKVQSNYTTTVTYPATSETDSRISPYDEVLGYQIVGSASVRPIPLTDLIKVWLNATTDITNQFTFVQYLDEDAIKYVKLVDTFTIGDVVYTVDWDNKKITYGTENTELSVSTENKFTLGEGETAVEYTVDWDNKKITYEEGLKLATTLILKIEKNVGSELSFTISATSKNLGVSYPVKIVLTSVYEIVGGFNDHGAEKPETSKENVYGVYAEAELNVLQEILIKELSYNESSTKWAFGIGSASGLCYSLLGASGEIIAATEIKDGEATVGIKFGDVAILNISDNAISSIVFNAVSGKYVLRVSNVANPTNYDIKKEFVFYVSPNIELGEVEGAESATETKDVIIGEEPFEGVEVLVIGNKENPVLNGQEIKFENNKIILIEDKIEIPVQRIKETDVSFGPVTIDGLDANKKISGVKELSTKTIKISYGGKDLFVEFYVAPNITANNAEKVTYDGKEYISLYAGMDISNISSWFVANNNPSNEVSVVLGNLVMDGKIKSLPRLYDIAKNNALIVKTEDGFIITQIYVTVGEGENQEVRAFDVLVSPFEWKKFIKYEDENGNDINMAREDIKDVLDGTLTTVILSGNNLVFDDETGNFYVNDVDSYINSSTNKMTYKLFKSEVGSKVEVQIIGETGFAYLGFDDGKLALITEPNAKNYIYRIEFTYTGKAEGFQDATFVFSYYVEATATQTIEVYYPHLENKSLENKFTINEETFIIDWVNKIVTNSSNETVTLEDDSFEIEEIECHIDWENKTIKTIEEGKETFVELEEVDFDNYNTLFTSNNKHIVYFDQFVDGKYEIELETNLRHYNEASNTFVKVAVEDDVTTNDPDASYNDINYSIYKLYSNNVEVVSGIENFVEVSKDGKITIKNNSSVLGIVIKAETPNGAVAYYKVLVKAREDQTITFEGNPVANIGGSVKISNGTSDVDFAPSNGFKYVIINEKGELQDSNNMISYDSTTGEIVVKPAPNEQSAILVIYSEALGTIAEIEVIAPSPIKVEFAQDDETVYGDSAVDLKLYIEATFNNDDVDENELDYRIEFDEEAYSYILYSEGSNFTIYPIAEEKTFKFKVYVWGEAEEGGENPLPGTSEDYPATIDGCELTLTPRITEKEIGREITIKADTANTKISAQNIFEIIANSGNNPMPDYKYQATLTWNGGENELIGIGDLETRVKDGDLFVTGYPYGNYASWTICVSHVAAQRTAVLTVKIWKEVEIDGSKKQLGEAVEGTYKIIINPVITATVTYPDYGTGETFDSETIYVKENVFEGETSEGQEGIDLKGDSRVVVAGGDVVYKSANPALIEIKDSTKVTVTGTGKAIEKLTPVAINICVQTAGADTTDETDDKYIVIGTYNLILSPNPVLKLEFENGGTEMSEIIPDSEFEADTDIFPIEDGKVSASMKVDSLNAGISAVTIYAKHKSNGTSMSPVTIYLLGDNNAKLAKLFISSNDNTGGMEVESTGRIDQVSSFDILGTSADDSIAEIKEDDTLIFKKVGSWFVEVTTTTGEGDAATTSVKYYYVFTSRGEDGEGEIDAQIYCPLEKSELSMTELFGNTNLTEYEFSYGNIIGNGISQINFTTPKTKLNFFYVSNGVEYEIPYQTAAENKTYFEIDDDKTISSLKYVLNYAQKEITIFNKFGTTVGTFDYKFVLDYKFDESKFNEVNTGNVGSGYDKGEFEGYKEGGTNVDLKVSETIELTAGIEYDLIWILKNNLGLTRLNGEDLVAPAKFKIELEYGKYLTNSSFADNKNGLISIIGNGFETKVKPHGAKNGGDIIHFMLTVKDDNAESELEPETYILRIKINPIAKIVANSYDGDYLIEYTNGYLTPAENNPKFKNNDHLLALNDLLSTENVQHKDLVISVISSNSESYVRKSSEGNRLASWYVGSDGTYEEEPNNDSSYEKVYGLVLAKTVLGGAEIELLITDNYGYQLTDPTGTPIIIKIKYSAEDGAVVQLDSVNSGNIIYEGDSFEIWASLEVGGTTFYAKYDNGSWTNYQTDVPTAEGESTPIVLDGIQMTDKEGTSIDNITDGQFTIPNGAAGTQYTIADDNIQYGSNIETEIDSSGFACVGNYVVQLTKEGENYTSGKYYSLTSLTVTLSDSETLKANENYWADGVLGSNNKVNYGDSALFGSENKLTGKNFRVTIKYTDDKGTPGDTADDFSETLSFDINTAVAQRYKLVLKDPYNSEDTVKLPYVKVGESYQVKERYQPEYIFEVYDLKNNATTTTDNSLPEIEDIWALDDHDFKTVENVEYSNTFFVKYGDGTWTGEYVIDEGQGRGTVSFDYEYVSEYCYLDLSGVNTYLTYGIVLEGAKEKLTDQAFFGKLKGAVLKDYYGNEEHSIGLIAGSEDSYTLNDFVRYTDQDADNWTLKGLEAGETINIPVYGDSEKHNIIGYIPVTRSRYEAIQTLGGKLAEEDGYLPFTVENGIGWGNIVFATVSGTNGKVEGLSGKTSGFFDYSLSVVSVGGVSGNLLARIVNTGEYYTIALNNQTSDFIVQVKYMGNLLGTFTVKCIKDKGNVTGWEVEQMISSLEIGGYLYKTTTVGDVSSLYCYGFPYGETQATQPQTVSTQTIEQTGPAANVPSTISITFNNKELTIPVAGVGNQTENQDGSYKWETILNAGGYTSVILGGKVLNNEGGVLYDGITSIAENAFNGCAGLISIEIPSSVTTIGTNAFSGCTSLESVTINGNIQSIGENAFSGCGGLKQITINGNISTIEGNIFNNCSNLKELKIGSNVSELPNNLFSGGNLVNLKTIYVESSTLTADVPQTSGGKVVQWIKDEVEKTIYSNFNGAGTYTAKFPQKVTVVYYDRSTLKSEENDVVYGDSFSPLGGATPPRRDGHEFTEWSWSPVPEDGKIYKSTTITAQYIELFSVDLSTNGYGTIEHYSISNGERIKDTDGDYKYTEGSTITFKITPNNGYHVSKITIGGTEKTYTQTEDLKNYTINSVTTNIEVKVSFSIKKYTVTFKNWDETVLSEQTITHGSSATAPADPTREGYTFDGWDKDFSNITDNLTVTALYDLNTYTVIFQDSDGTELKKETVNWGESLEFTVAPPDSRYGIASISGAQDNTVTAINGESQTISLTDIREDYTITVTFAALDLNWKLVKNKTTGNLDIQYLGSAESATIPLIVNGKEWAAIDTTTSNYQKLRVITNEATLSTEQALPTVSNGKWYNSTKGEIVENIKDAGTYVAVVEGATYLGFGYTLSEDNKIYITSLPSLEQNGNSTELTIPGQVEIGESGVMVDVYGLKDRNLGIGDINAAPWSTLADYSTVILDDRIQYVGKYAFHNYGNESPVKTIILGSGVNKVDTSAFNRGYINLEINSNFTTKSGGLLSWTGTINKLTIGENVTKECQEVETLIKKASTVEIADGNTYFEYDSEGVLYGNNKTEIYKIKSTSNIKLTSDITYIADSCYSKSFNKLTLGAGVDGSYDRIESLIDNATTVEVKNENTYFKKVDDVLYGNSETEIYRIEATVQQLEISDKIRYISKKALQHESIEVTKDQGGNVTTVYRYDIIFIIASSTTQRYRLQKKDTTNDDGTITTSCELQVYDEAWQTVFDNVRFSTEW